MSRPSKKILTVDVRMIHHAGIGTYIRNLIPLILDHYRVFLLASGENLQEFNWINQVEIIETGSSIYSVSEQLELSRKIPRTDVFWSPHFNIPLLPVRAKKRIVTIHDVYHLAFYDLLPLMQKLYARYMFRRAVKKSDKIITVSNTSREEICRYTGASRENIAVIYNGVNRKLFRIESNGGVLKQIRNKYQLPERYILSVGSIKPHKNLKRLLLAFRKFLQDGEDIKLFLAGKKEGLITTDRESAVLIKDDPFLKDRVIFTSWLPEQDLALLYNLATLFIFPSLYEGFGLPPLEAMACGCPALVSDIDIMREICEDAAYYADPLDVNAIADSIGKLLSDRALCSELKEKGLHRTAHFNWQESAQQHIQVIDKIIAS